MNEWMRGDEILVFRGANVVCEAIFIYEEPDHVHMLRKDRISGHYLSFSQMVKTSKMGKNRHRFENLSLMRRKKAHGPVEVDDE